MKLTTLILTATLLGSPVYGDPIQQQETLRAELEDLPAYTIGPEDVLTVVVWQEPDLLTTVTVRPDGRISLPLINEVEVGGRTPEEVQEVLTSSYEAYLGAPVVSIIVSQINSRKISILGNVATPGRYDLLSDLTIFDAIALAGGFAQFAKRDEVYVVRRSSGAVERFKLNIPEMIEKSSAMPFMLLPSDTIYVK